MYLLWLSTGKCNSAVGRTAEVQCNVSHKWVPRTPAFRNGATGCSKRLRILMMEKFFGGYNFVCTNYSSSGDIRQ